MNTIEVEITHGKIRGARHEGVTIFKGIPYAGRVSGDQRFRRPAELQPWPGVRDALQLGAPAIQPSRPNEPEPAEDCLFLNIWTPATDNRKRPVMFYSLAHPFDPTAPAISRNKPLMTGWNEDEYTFFAWERGDTSAFTLDFDSLQSKLETQYGSDTKRIIDTYRRAMPNASAPDIFVAISSITMMGLGSVEIAEKKAAQPGAPVYLFHSSYHLRSRMPIISARQGQTHPDIVQGAWHHCATKWAMRHHRLSADGASVAAKHLPEMSHLGWSAR